MWLAKVNVNWTKIGLLHPHGKGKGSILHFADSSETQLSVYGFVVEHPHIGLIPLDLPHDLLDGRPQ